MGIFSKIMGTHSERELKRVYPIVDKIEAMGPAMEKLSDEELRAKTDEFKISLWKLMQLSARQQPVYLACAITEYS